MRLFTMLLLLTAALVRAQYLEQTDWSGGPGMVDPSLWWDDRFQESEGIDWSSTPGEITLLYSPAGGREQASAPPRREDDTCSGTLISGMAWIPMGTDWEIEWGDILWTAEVPGGSDLYFRLRTGITPDAMSPWTDPITESGTYLGDLLPEDDILLIQYMVCLQSDSFDPDSWPVLYDVTVEGWYPGGIAETPEMEPGAILRVLGSPGHGAVTLAVAGPGASGGELSVFDLSGRLMARFLPGASPGDGDGFVFSGSPGAYVARFLTDAAEQRRSFVLIE